MNSEVVEEVVPFFELLLAPLEFADEQLRPPVSLRVEKLMVYIIFGSWNVDTRVKEGEIYLRAHLGFYLR